ncbi:prepilin-type N-terminal cleavage/methylation domain-containing protein [bacterium]|nr:prepilin-type N-terminal cleavage/methylation domain-containing protein [bacterium]
MRRKERGAAGRQGFSLIELLIVIAVIGIIATIAIPILMETRRNSLDEKARQCVRIVLSAQQAFYASEGRFGDFTELASSTPPYLDSRFASGTGLMGNNVELDLQLTGGGSGFIVNASNPAGHFDYSADESMEIIVQ